MLDSKFFLKSKTIWGVIVAFVPALLGAFGFDGSMLAGFEGAGAALIDAFNQLNEAVGAVLIVWGRMTADSKLALKGTK